ncbi:unnamed protein product [Mytilus coruscus]|uniref:Uncharacterized protein n=1 Tax=Mytilus coruscus TaxID=42192 RepID=A0A6J8B9Y6_MYTCO|nr:unnamed protein product [Mytilus coruscus]
MHDLAPDKALLYWIPSGLVAIGMFITLLCSFWKFHKRKVFIRQLQKEYMEVNLAIKRPRIGAIRCNTHGAKWEDLMASLSSSGFPNIAPYFRHINQVKNFNTCGTLYEEKEDSPDRHLPDKRNHEVYDHEIKTGINAYYEQAGYIESETKPIREKKKKKKRSKVNFYGATYHKDCGDSIEIATASSPRRLPVIENHLWTDYTRNSPPSNERKIPSIYYARSFIHSNDNEVFSPPHKVERAESKRSAKQSKRSKREKPSQEERVFWVLAADIQQSSV